MYITEPLIHIISSTNYMTLAVLTLVTNTLAVLKVKNMKCSILFRSRLSQNHIESLNMVPAPIFSPKMKFLSEVTQESAGSFGISSHPGRVPSFLLVLIYLRGKTSLLLLSFLFSPPSEHQLLLSTLCCFCTPISQINKRNA